MTGEGDTPWCPLGQGGIETAYCGPASGAFARRAKSRSAAAISSRRLGVDRLSCQLGARSQKGFLEPGEGEFLHGTRLSAPASASPGAGLLLWDGSPQSLG